MPGIFLMAALSGLAGCGSQTAQVTVGSEPGSPSASQTPASVPSQSPSETRSPRLTAGEPDLSALSDADRSILEHYQQAKGKDSLRAGSWIFASPLTVEEAKLRLLGPSPTLGTEANVDQVMNAEASAYAFLQVGDGVIAYEDTGFADPPRRLLAALSAGGAVSAVATDNIEAMTRFGYARDGQVVFDAYEYAFVDDLEEIPAEVRDLAALAWEDLDGPSQDTADWFDVAMAMSEKVTGIRADQRVDEETEWYLVPLPWSASEGE